MRRPLTPFARLAIALVLGLVVMLFARERYSDPPPRDASTNVAEFSAIRARSALTRVLDDEGPHPTGSPAAAHVRERIVQGRHALGLEPRVQDGFACGSNGVCAFVKNVVAEIPGASREAVLVAAHYDCVGAGNGANDDGSGVSVLLEMARALKASPALPRSVIFLFDEAEEDGLLGARAFAESDPDFPRVVSALNFDARGGHGPALIFETSADNAEVVRSIASSVVRPATSSLFYSIYQRMPNGSDFTVWKAKARGANIAFVGDISSYHTALDRLDHASVGVVQDEGDAGLALARSFATADRTASGDTVWFDVLALFVVRWDITWSRAFAIFALVLVLLAAGVEIGAGGVKPSRVLLGLAALPASLIVAIGLGVGLHRALSRLGAMPASWTANAPAIMASAWLAGIAIACASASLFGRGRARGLFYGVWTIIGAMGVAVAWTVPGASYVLIVPTVGAAIASLLVQRVKYFDPAIATIVPMVLFLIVLAPMLLLTYDSLGTSAIPLVAALGTLLTMGLSPLVAPLPRRARALLPRVLLGVSAASAIVASQWAPFSATTPSRVNVVFLQDPDTSRIAIDPSWGGRPWGSIPHEMIAALGGGARDGVKLPWEPDHVRAIEAPRIDAPLPELSVESESGPDGARDLTVRLRSPRRSRNFVLATNAGSIMRVNDRPMNGKTRDGWSWVAILGVPDEGVTVRLVLQGARGSAEVEIADESLGVPSFAMPIVEARPASATPTQRGDVTILSRAYRP